MAVSVSRWNAFEVLDIGDISSGFTCFGYAPSQRRRCHNPIAMANRQAAITLLRQMSELDASSASVTFMLQSLASRILCKRNHQSQAPCLVQHWLDNISRLQALKLNEQVQNYWGPVLTARFNLSQTAEPRRMILAEGPASVRTDRIASTQRRDLAHTSSGTTQAPQVERHREINRQRSASRHSRGVSHTRNTGSMRPSSRSPTAVQNQPNDTIVRTSRRGHPREEQEEEDNSTQRRTVSDEQSNLDIVTSSHRQETRPAEQQNRVISPRSSQEMRVRERHDQLIPSTTSQEVEQHDPNQNAPGHQRSPSTRQEAYEEEEQQSGSGPTTDHPRSPSHIPESHEEVEQQNEPSQASTDQPRNLSPVQETREEEEQQNEGGQSTSHPRSPGPGQESSEAEQQQQNEPGRRAVEGDCSICHEDLNEGGILLWCKAQCGQNFHQGCIITWLETSYSERKCPYW